jgi:CDP-glucose 4,6-dehydratase
MSGHWIGRLHADAAFWRDRPVLVTGATGLVGSWLCEALCGLGAAVTALVRDDVPASRLWSSGARVSVVRGAVEDQAAVERALGEYEAECVFHLAAQTIVGIANRNPVSTFESNIRGTWCVLEACRRSPLVKRIVLASSDKAYGDHETLPYDEDAPLQGRHPYDVSKSCADLLAQTYHATWGLPVAITRCGNFFGPGDLNWNRLVPGTLRSVARGERPVIRSDGTFVRDYFYVKDGVGAYLRLAERLRDEGVAGRAFNFSNDEPLSVLAMTARVLEAAGSRLEPVIMSQASNEIHDQYLSSVRARRELGWAPGWTPAEALAETVEWYRAHLSAPAGGPA